MIIVAIIGYVVFSTLYYYLEKVVIKNVFYSGSNPDYFHKVRGSRKEKIKMIRVHSDIKEYSHVYHLWMDLVTEKGQKISCDKVLLECTDFFDVKGNVNKENIFVQFKKYLDAQLTK